MAFVRALGRRDLAVLWVSQVSSAMGDQIYLIALLWLAIGFAGNGAGLVAAAGAASSLVFGLFGGVFADRWDRRRAMVAADLLRAGIVGALPLLAHLHALALWHLVAATALVGALATLFDPALQASLPALAEDAQTLRATNALMDVTRRLARTLGPGLVGLLAGVLPVTHYFTLDAVSFIISAVAIASLGRRYAWRAADNVADATLARRRTPHEAAARFTSDVAGAVHAVRGHGALAWMFAVRVPLNMAWAIAFTVGAPMLARGPLGGGVATFGLIVAAYGVGNVAANLVLGALTIRHPERLLWTSKLVLGAGFVAVALAPSLPVALVGAAVAAVGGPMGDLVVLTLIQRDIPAGQMGKVFGLDALVENGGVALGLALATPFYALVPARGVVLLCALLMLALGVQGALYFRRLRSSSVGEMAASPHSAATQPEVAVSR